jgi:pimeloyl-ACP methyl ester carboxylesterase
MYAIVRENTYDPEKLARGRSALDEFRAVHAAQPGYLWSAEVEAGEGRWFVVNVWDSREAATAALPRMVPVVQRLLDPLMAAPSKLLGAGPVVATDLVHPPRPVAFRTARVGDLDIAYREAGPADAPALLLLHGFPSSSRMFMPLFPLLADQRRLVAPDLPGFGHSSAPPPGAFAYTFDRLAEVIDAFCDAIGLARYALYLQDYGGPVGFRLALAHPGRVAGIVVQNAVAHEEGLSPAWDLRRVWWRDRAAHEDEVRRSMLSIETARARHLHGPHPELIDPDTWTDEHAFLHRDGMDRIQLELAHDYRTNVASYPAWQRYLRDVHPPLLVVWGRHDPLFTERGAWAYRDDVPDAEIHLLDAGHFALDLAAPAVAALVRGFLARVAGASAPAEPRA